MLALLTLLAMLVLPSVALATDYTVALNGTTANQDAGLARLYVDACKDRVAAGQGALAGCTAGCVCTPTKAQYETAMSTLLRNTLSNKYSNLLDAEAGEIKSKYPSLTPEQQSAIRAQCPSCVF